MASQKGIPIKCNTDLSPDYFDEFTAVFIKNLSTYIGANNEIGAATAGQNVAVLKPLQANEIYCNLANEPDPGQNICVGAKGFPQVNRVYVWVWNPNGNHFIYRINGDTRTCEMVKIDPCFNFQLDPKHFIHDTAAWLEVFTLVDPDTGLEVVKEELYWTDGFNYQGYLRVQDSIDTNGFDETLYPYFKGNYDKCNLVRMGIPTPKSCIEIQEIPVKDDYVTVQSFSNVNIRFASPNIIIVNSSLNVNILPNDKIVIPLGNIISGEYLVQSIFTNSTTSTIMLQGSPFVSSGFVDADFLISRLSGIGVNNNLLFNTWQFRVSYVDVWGRVSLWGIISDMYIPGINDCIATSSNLARCLNLIFSAGDPTINSIDIAYRNCNDETWRKETTLFLYNGSNIGKWWLRQRNPDIEYDPVTNRISYKFCRDKECEAIAVEETNMLQPALPKTSQALVKLPNLLAVANNKDGFNPFPKSLRDKFGLEVLPPPATDLGLRNITIYCPIWNSAEPAFFSVSKGRNGYFFGNNTLIPLIGIQGPAETIYQQSFKNLEQSGFNGYLVGGGSCISTQVYFDENGVMLDDPLHNKGLVAFNQTNPVPHFTLQKFVFNNVPKGKYVFRLASHLSDSTTDPNYRQTSTTVWGRCNYSRTGGDPRDAYFNIDLQNRQASQELVIDVCNGNYNTLDINEILVILDMSAAVNGQPTQASCGYVYETSKNRKDELPIELAYVTYTGGQFGSGITDHNGFYYYGTRGSNRDLIISIRDNCTTKQMVVPQTTAAGTEFRNFIADTNFPGYSNRQCNRVFIKGQLLLNNSNIGVSNVAVVLTRGYTAITDDDGYFEIIAHDYVKGLLRLDKVIISPAGCAYTAAGGGCLPDFQINFTVCVGGCPERKIDVGTGVLVYETQRGLLSGGSYSGFVSGYDWLGRKTFAQPIKNITIPSVIQSQSIAPSVISGTIDPTAVFPDEIKYITYSISEETTIDKYLSWIVDRFEFIDNTGAINNVTPSQIRIYYQSIIEYSAVNNYNTTTAWQFIPTGQNTPAISDKVQFILNGDGKFFDKNITSLVKYDQSGTYFTIDYTSDLRDLKNSALIRLMRPKTCTGTEPCFEICKVVEVVNGKAQENSFVLNFFDTYYLSRQIPVPAVLSSEPTTTQVTTASTIDGITTTVTQTPVPKAQVLELRTFGFRFEHGSPSNFWGDNCKNFGRINVKNPYEAELLHPNQIATGGALSANGQLNYLAYFDEIGKHDVLLSDTSGIVAVIVENGLLFIITQNDNCQIGYNDNLARINEQGQVLVPSAASRFGQPERKVGDRYGCSLIDKMSIQSRDGLVMYASRSRGEAVQYNFSQITSLTKDETQITPGVQQGKYDAAFIAKIKSMQADSTRFFVGGIDPNSNEYLLTDFSLSNLSYINTQRTYLPNVNETVVFDIKTKTFKGWRSFTPEGFAYLDGDLLNRNLFTFKGATAYSHYNVNTNNLYNTFYGVKCERVIDIVANKPVFKKKKWLSISNYCKQSLYFSDQIITEAGQLSYLYLDNFQKADFFSFAPFMCDINTPQDAALGVQINNNPLMEGNQLYGLWIRVRLIGEPSMDDKYSELFGIVIDSFDEEKTG